MNHRELQHPPAHALIVGASGGIGQALLEQLLADDRVQHVHCTARDIESRVQHPKVTWYALDFDHESSLEALSRALADKPPLSLIFVATGILHEGEIFPERSWRQMQASALQRLYHVNAVAPAMLAKHLLARLDSSNRSVFACLGARIGSISDNRSGGWYAYRMSKAALAMLIKTLAIELRRSNNNAIAVALHPGTVQSKLSKPFLKEGTKRRFFSPRESAEQLLAVVDRIEIQHSGAHLDYAGLPIEA